MRKFLFTLLTCAATLAASAQTNLALSKTAIATTGDAAAAVDGNKGTRWESVHGQDPQKWQVDLGSEQDMNTFKIIWEGAYAKDFTIKVGNTLDGEGWLSDGTTVVTVNDQNLANLTALYSTDNTVTGRYVLFEGTERATPYGYSFYEFEVYNFTEAFAVTNVNLTATGNQPLTVGGTLTLNAACTNQLGGSIEPTTLTYNSSDPTVATISGNVLTAAAAGTTTITAVADGVTSNAIEVTVLGAEKIDLFSNYQYRIFGIGEKLDRSSIVGAFDDNLGSVWALIKGETAADENSRTYTVGFVADLGGLYDIAEVSMNFEGACSEKFTLQFAGEDGVFGEAAYTGGRTGINAHTEEYYPDNTLQARYVKFVSTKAATQWGVKLYDFSVYGTGTPTIDATAPTVTASLESAAEEEVVLSITGNDNSAKYLAYEISAEGLPTAIYALEGNKAGEAAQVTVKGLNGGTTYNFSIVAIDDKGNRSAAATVEATTSGDVFVLTPAPTPTQAAEDVISIYSDAYTEATTRGIGLWGQSTQLNETNIDGNNTMYLTNFNYLGFELGTQLNASEMQYLHIDVLPMQAMNLGITPIFPGPIENSQLVGTLNVKEWNSIDIPLTQYNMDFANNLVFQLKLDRGTGNDKLYVDNIYFWKGEDGPVVPTELAVKEIDSETEAVVLEGVWDATKFAAIDAEQKALAYDLSNVTGNVEGEISTVMPNALLITNATQNVAKNRVVWDNAQNRYTGYNIVLDENDTQTANGVDYSVNTNIAPIYATGVVKQRFHDGAGVYATTIAPFDGDVDSGIDAWEMTAVTDDGENKTIEFSQVYTFEAGKAYIIYFARAAAFWLRGNGKTIEWAADASKEFQGTFSKVSKDGLNSVYVLDGNNQQPNFAKNAFDIPAWRAYLDLGNVSSAANINVTFDGVTAIENVEQLIPTLFNVYSIDGRMVRQNADSMMSLPAGVYVVNGKKVVVK